MPEGSDIDQPLISHGMRPATRQGATTKNTPLPSAARRLVRSIRSAKHCRFAHGPAGTPWPPMTTPSHGALTKTLPTLLRSGPCMVEAPHVSEKWQTRRETGTQSHGTLEVSRVTERGALCERSAPYAHGCSHLSPQAGRSSWPSPVSRSSPSARPPPPRTRPTWSSRTTHTSRRPPSPLCSSRPARSLPASTRERMATCPCWSPTPPSALSRRAPSPRSAPSSRTRPAPAGTRTSRSLADISTSTLIPAGETRTLVLSEAIGMKPSAGDGCQGADVRFTVTVSAS